jgi:hypothetical protein
MEHLCLYHLVRGRMARRSGDFDVARLAVEEGLRVASHCGFWLYQVELLCEQAELQTAGFGDTGAVRSAREAFELASSPVCQFLWGAAEAAQVLGRALFACGLVYEARAALKRSLTIRRQIWDPRVEQTEALLRSLPG